MRVLLVVIMLASLAGMVLSIGISSSTVMHQIVAALNFGFSSTIFAICTAAFYIGEKKQQPKCEQHHSK